MRKTFADITQTIWLVISDENILPYRPNVTEKGNVNITLINTNIWINAESSRIVQMGKARKVTKKRGISSTKINAAMRKIGTSVMMGHHKAADKALKGLEREIKKKDPNIPKGFCLIKTKDGKDILWQE